MDIYQHQRELFKGTVDTFVESFAKGEDAKTRKGHQCVSPNTFESLGNQLYILLSIVSVYLLQLILCR